MENEALETSKFAYARATGMLRVAAEQVAEIEIPEETVRKWRTLFVSIRVVDHRLDNLPTLGERDQFGRDLFDFLEGRSEKFSDDDELQSAVRGTKNLIDQISPEKRDSFLRALRGILSTTEQVRGENEGSAYVKSVRLEGQLTARLFLSLLPDEFSASEKYPLLVRALTRLGRAGNTFDSLVDLSDDNEKGRARLSPNLMNRAMLLGALLTDGASFLRTTGVSPEMLRRIVRGSYRTIRDNPDG